ncbi:alkaline phosphatase D family protein [Solicola gregarius]|uniref:Alkaline phosphatase D family protein n=1 Tax=Solicola gregarius TaxID=2908642 RepID=A0AA46YJQ6_9ACTN|nr:alkaline phosphatase D family protein [Solicola gregarius]UYM04602.1 alkaline phosphatase D family protein [Solicola gregarius]
MSTLSRRRVLSTGAAVSAGAATSALPPSSAAAHRDHFRHGIASGDPLPHSVVLWSRVTPTSASTPGSGHGPRVNVRWEIATDRRFRNLAGRGTARTGPGRDHTVKVDASGLKPDTTYFYRFTYDGTHSPIGRTRTAPADNASPRRLRFGVVSCANLQAGYFAAYRHLAGHDLDAVIHLGDYVYEYGPGEYGYGKDDANVRKHQPRHEMVSLADYRQRHAQYKRDPDLGALHAKVPFIVTWDDHETANDAWRGGAENHDPATERNWRRRRADARRAYDEWMPVRMNGSATLGDGVRLYRRLRFGRLAELSMLDLRSYRDEQASSPVFGGVSDPDRTITGERQLSWLRKGLATDSQWKLIGNPVMIAPVQIPPLSADVSRAVERTLGDASVQRVDGIAYNVDQWDGYTADRLRLLRHIADHGITDTVFLTGDIHSSWACDIPRNAAIYPLGDTVATELVCSSVTSNNLDDLLGVPPRTGSLAVEAALQTLNRHVRYLNFDDHGYSVLDVTPARVQMDWYKIGDRADRRTRAQHQASWAVEAGSQKVRPAAAPVEG